MFFDFLLEVLVLDETLYGHVFQLTVDEDFLEWYPMHLVQAASLFCRYLSSASMAGVIRIIRPLASQVCRFADLMRFLCLSKLALVNAFGAVGVFKCD